MVNECRIKFVYFFHHLSLTLVRALKLHQFACITIITENACCYHSAFTASKMWSSSWLPLLCKCRVISNKFANRGHNFCRWLCSPKHVCRELEYCRFLLYKCWLCFSSTVVNWVMETKVCKKIGYNGTKCQTTLNIWISVAFKLVCHVNSSDLCGMSCSTKCHIITSPVVI